MRCTPREMHAHEVHARKMHAHEMHAHEMHTCEVNAHEIYAHRSGHEVMKRSKFEVAGEKCAKTRNDGFLNSSLRTSLANKAILLRTLQLLDESTT